MNSGFINLCQTQR